MSQKVEKVQKGGGGGQLCESKSPQFKNADFLYEGGGQIFRYFPNVNVDFKFLPPESGYGQFLISSLNFISGGQNEKLAISRLRG